MLDGIFVFVFLKECIEASKAVTPKVGFGRQR